jgi:hypothetical protein
MVGKGNAARTLLTSTANVLWLSLAIFSLALMVLGIESTAWAAPQASKDLSQEIYDTMMQVPGAQAGRPCEGNCLRRNFYGCARGSDSFPRRPLPGPTRAGHGSLF